MSVAVLACLSAILSVPSDLEARAQHMRDLSAPPQTAKADASTPASYEEWQPGDQLPRAPRFYVEDYVNDLAKLPPDPGTFQALIENDVIFTIDRHYSSGVNGLYTTSAGGTPGWMKSVGHLFADDGEVHATFGGGHNIYTPRSIIIQNLDDRDRPYAGFLYGIAGVQTITPRHFDDLTLTAGVTGPIALGKQVQEIIHAAIGPTPLRWDTQLKNEPVGVRRTSICGGCSLVHYRGLAPSLYPHVGATLGTVYTYLAQGLSIRFGNHMPLDYGPSRVLPAIQGSGVFRQVNDFGWYFFAGGELREIARNIWLDGNTFVDSRRVPKLPVVGDLQFGWALVWPGFRVSMTHVLRSKEFEKQVKPDLFGSLDLAWHID